MVELVCGTPKGKFLQVWREMIGSTSHTPTRA